MNAFVTQENGDRPVSLAVFLNLEIIKKTASDQPSSTGGLVTEASLYRVPSLQRNGDFENACLVVQAFSVAFSSDGKLVVSGSDDMLVKIWDAETGAEVSWFVGMRAFSVCGEVALLALRAFTAGIALEVVGYEGGWRVCQTSGLFPAWLSHASVLNSPS